MVSITRNFDSKNMLMDLRSSQLRLNDTLGRLSSGERIQSAKDGASDLAISNNLRSDIRALNQVKRSHFDGMNFVNLANDELGNVVEVLQRISQLATQAASGTSGPDGAQGKVALDREYQELLQEIDDINLSSSYNEATVFGSSGSSYVLNLMPEIFGSDTQLTINTSSFSTQVLGLNGTDLTTGGNAGSVLTAAKAAISLVTRQQGRLGALAERLESNMETIEQFAIQSQDRESEIRDADIAAETVRLTQFQIINQSTLAAMGQANLNPERVFELLG